MMNCTIENTVSSGDRFRDLSFEKAVCEELGTLEKMAVWYTGDPMDAEDLVQDTIVLALRFRESYRKGSNMRAWLLKVMRNRHISLTRRVRLERRVLESEAHHALTDWSLSEIGRRNMEDGGGVDQDLGFSDPVVRAMDALRPEFREVVKLCDIEELTYVEAAERISCPVGTVMSRLHRGRRALRERLGSKRALDAA
jgi:RNA polymerase sigma-70 factor (ECF subfamily)